jgi:hypothetical protein
MPLPTSLRLPLALAVLVIGVAVLFLVKPSHPGLSEIVAFAVDSHSPDIALGLSSGDVILLSLRDQQFREARRIPACSGAWMNALSYTSAHDLVCGGEKLRILTAAGALRDLSIPRSVSGGAFGSSASISENLAVVTASERILLVDQKSGAVKNSFGEPTALYGDLRTSADGKFLVASGHTAQVWSLNSNGVYAGHRLFHSNYTFGPMAFAADRLYIGNQDGCVYIWRISDWAQLPRFCTNAGTVVQLAVSPDGSRIAIAANRVLLLEPDTARIAGVIERHGVVGMAFTPDGDLLMASTDRVEVWSCSIQGCGGTPAAQYAASRAAKS